MNEYNWYVQREMHRYGVAHCNLDFLRYGLPYSFNLLLKINKNFKWVKIKNESESIVTLKYIISFFQELL